MRQRQVNIISSLCYFVVIKKPDFDMSNMDKDVNARIMFRVYFHYMVENYTTMRDLVAVVGTFLKISKTSEKKTKIPR